MEVELPPRAARVRSRVPVRPRTAGTITGSLGRDPTPSPVLSSHWTDTSGGHLPAWHQGQPRWPPLRAMDRTESLFTGGCSASRGSAPSDTTRVEMSPPQVTRARPGPALCAGFSPTSGPCLSPGQAAARRGRQSGRLDQTQRNELPPSAASSARSLRGSAESSETNPKLKEQSLVGHLASIKVVTRPES